MSWWDKSQVVEMSVVEMSVALMSVGQKSRHHDIMLIINDLGLGQSRQFDHNNRMMTLSVIT
jgi:hypothetical protein